MRFHLQLRMRPAASGESVGRLAPRELHGVLLLLVAACWPWSASAHQLGAPSANDAVQCAAMHPAHAHGPGAGHAAGAPAHAVGGATRTWAWERASDEGPDDLDNCDQDSDVRPRFNPPRTVTTAGGMSDRRLHHAPLAQPPGHVPASAAVRQPMRETAPSQLAASSPRATPFARFARAPRGPPATRPVVRV